MPIPAVIDAHAHCGIMDRDPPQAIDDYARELSGTGIQGAALFSPVAEIYDRDDPFFEDNPKWQSCRQASNAYLLSLEPKDLNVYPYFFIWNDFAVDQLTPKHRGIKWHRHPDEPVYNYQDPKCHQALKVIRQKNLPVVLEEEFENTLFFIQELAAGISVIIPHLGLLNGGFQALARSGIWELDNVWADTALASEQTIEEYILRYGPDKLLFGSDFPFGSPSRELSKVQSLKLDPGVQEALLGGNFLRLQGLVEG
ncbi:MAG: amidohydrolase family protein [Desulfovermiculus sp.]